jgi:hypothetical protein
MSTQPSPVTVVATPELPQQPAGLALTDRTGGTTADLVLRVVTAGAALVILLMSPRSIAVSRAGAMPTIKRYGLGRHLPRPSGGRAGWDAGTMRESGQIVRD